MSNLCKITVVRKTLQDEYFEKYNHGVEVKHCVQFEIGQEFYSTTTKLPQNFCAWAYDDIAKDLALVAYDPTGRTTKFTCCTSGFHNVYFYIESVGPADE